MLKTEMAYFGCVLYCDVIYYNVKWSIIMYGAVM